MTNVKRRSSNAQAGRERGRNALFFGLIQVLLLLGLAGLQAGLLLSGDSQLYQAPRMRPFMIFSTAAFLLMGLYGLRTLLAPAAEISADCGCGHAHTPSFQAKIAIVVLFGLVLSTGFFLPHQVLDSRVAEKKGIALSRLPATGVFGPERELRLLPEDHLFFQESMPWDSAQAVDLGPTETGLDEEQARLREELGIWYDRELHRELSEDLLARQTLRITDEDFLDSMLIISAYLDDFVGRHVDFCGFVFHDGTMAENELAVARIAVTCCLADASVYGLLVRAPDLPLPPNDAWVRVQGRIQKTRFIEEDIPLILADSLEVIPAPEQPYVYPRLYSRYVLEPAAK